MVSLGNKLDVNQGVGPGFDILRLGLAISIVFWHSFVITPSGIIPDEQPWFWLPHFGMLMMFFALSGFLISGSALRLSLPNFLLNRGLRIFPALAVEIVLSAMVLGPIFTILPLHSYFTSYNTYHYLTNIIAIINYDLPGVFTNNPSKLVNSSLWTIPAEFLSYFLMSVFVLCGALNRPVATTVTAVGLSLAGFLLMKWGFSKHSHGLPGVVFSHFDIGPTTRVTTAFVAGVVIYQQRYRIAYSGRLALLCIACLAAIASIPASSLSLPTLGLITAAPFAYLTVFIGASAVPTLKILRQGDYSYGIYLYGFPVQQAVYSLTSPIKSPWLQFLFALPPLVLFAAFSWHFIEKPVLAQRRRFSFVAKIRDVNEEPAAGTIPPRQHLPPGVQALNMPASAE